MLEVRVRGYGLGVVVSRFGFFCFEGRKFRV